jgi:hypothetical protein
MWPSCSPCSATLFPAGLLVLVAAWIVSAVGDVHQCLVHAVAADISALNVSAWWASMAPTSAKALAVWLFAIPGAKSVKQTGERWRQDGHGKRRTDVWGRACVVA